MRYFQGVDFKTEVVELRGTIEPVHVFPMCPGGRAFHAYPLGDFADQLYHRCPDCNSIVPMAVFEEWMGCARSWFDHEPHQYNLDAVFNDVNAVFDCPCGASWAVSLKGPWMGEK
jgi:hypothetical protein